MLLVDALEWIILGLFLAACLQFEFRILVPVLVRKTYTFVQIPLAQCVFWISAALMFNVLIIVLNGWEVSQSWFSGYVLEYTLSIDNLFIFQVLFRMYDTPVDQIDKALLFGISAAAGLRLVFFVIGTSLFEWISWIKYPLGVLLLITAWKTARTHAHVSSGATTPGEVPEGHPGTPQPSDPTPVFSLVVNCEKVLPVDSRYDKNAKFFQRANSTDLIGPASSSSTGWKMTMLGVVVLALTFVDVVFALDAVAAKVSQTFDLFVNFSSSLFAMMSFRALYHIIAELTAKFVLLKYGIAAILGYVGIELIVSNWIKIPNQVSSGIILSACILSITISVIYAKYTSTSQEYSTELANNFGIDDA